MEYQIKLRLMRSKVELFPPAHKIVSMALETPIFLKYIVMMSSTIWKMLKVLSSKVHISLISWRQLHTYASDSKDLWTVYKIHIQEAR